MRALQVVTPRLAEQGPLQPLDLPLPQPAAGQVRLRLTVCGVCHTDLHIAEGDIHPPALPIVPGHQAVGVVDALPPDGDAAGLSLGQRVGVPWLYAACGQCEFCQRGEENLCPNARFTGFHVNGGFAEYMLAEARYALPIPAEIPDEQAAPLLCAGIIGYRSLHKADVQGGERLGLVGFGASAHLAIQVARHWGCEVYVFTRSPEHRRHALSLGAAWVGGLEDRPPRPLDRAITFAPAGELIPRILEKLRPGGTLAINAVHLSPLPAMPYALIYGERTLRSVANATYQDGLQFLRLAVAIGLRAEVALYPFAEANTALADLKHSRLNGEAVLCINPAIHPPPSR